jgi:hypothetical protein
MTFVSSSNDKDHLFVIFFTMWASLFIARRRWRALLEATASCAASNNAMGILPWALVSGPKGAVQILISGQGLLTKAPQMIYFPMPFKKSA